MGPAADDKDDPVVKIAEAIRAWRIAEVLRPYADKYHAGYLRSIEAEISGRVWVAVGSDARFMRKLEALRVRGELARLTELIVKYERKALKRISREVMHARLSADKPLGFACFMAAKRRVASLIFGKVG